MSMSKSMGFELRGVVGIRDFDSFGDLLNHASHANTVRKPVKGVQTGYSKRG